MQELAEEALRAHDPTSTMYGDEYHEYFDDFTAAKTTYRQMYRRLARLICDGVDHTEFHEDDEEVPPRSRSNLN